MFSNSRHTQISGNPQFIYNDIKNNINSELLDNGMQLLLLRVVKEAMHNSGERFDPPTCHPETRVALQGDILGWADELVDDLNEVVTWLYGPAGAGKSAIAQTIAQKLHDRGQLTASFFFSRASGGEGRGAETDLIATLAYQLSQTVPATQPYIAATVRKNPLVFDLALQDQVNALIVAPLIAISHMLSGTEKPRVIVVDALDECRREKDAQRRVVDALILGLRQIPYHAHKLFITSRPEHNIVSVFNNHEEKMFRRIELDNRWNPDDDIRTFLYAGFADIRRSHFYFQIHPANKTWPHPKDIETLVGRSSGQFIYASVVLRYIKSEDNYNPATRLETILNLDNNEDRPYAELDALYHYIFSQIQCVESVLGILSLERLYESGHVNPLFRPPLITFLFDVLGLDEGLIAFRLRPLNSLLVWSDDCVIRYKHASLPDFLLDDSRSGSYYINPLTFVIEMVSRGLKWFKGGITPEKFRSGTFLLWIPVYYAQMLPIHQKFHVWVLLSDFNVVETVLCKQEINFDDEGLPGLLEYLNWIVEESDNKDYNDASSYLSKPVAQIRTWVINLVELVNVDYLDNEQIDVWPFFMKELFITPKEIPDQLAQVSTILGYPRLRGKKLQPSHCNQIALLFFLMRDLRWFCRSDFLGRHTMTPERYGVALKCTAYYLLQLPEHMLSEVLKDHRYRPSYTPPPILRRIGGIFPTFLARSPLTTDLCFLVALLCPVMVVLCERNAPLTRYIEKAFKKFPFLLEPTSKNYIQAGAKVTAGLINSKIKTHLHKLAEQTQMSWLLEWRLPYISARPASYNWSPNGSLSYKHLLETFADIDSRVSES